jgi:histidine triad (HIT) family protein
MEDCIFCKVVSGQAPADRVYEDEKVIAFLDLRPTSRGHALVIHKTHTTDLLNTPDDLLEEMMPKVKKIAAGIIKTTGASGFNLSVNNGFAAGQVVFHFHFHIVPRYENDGLKLFPQKDSEFAGRKNLADEIKKNIS